MFLLTRKLSPFTILRRTSATRQKSDISISKLFTDRSKLPFYQFSSPTLFHMAPAFPSEREVHFRTPVPKGYVFVKKGDVYITRHCSQQTKDSGKPLYIVVNDKSHRIGIRVPHPVHATVLASSARTAATRRLAVQARDAAALSSARTTLFRIFPAIPPAAATQILEHAFQKFSGRVGRTAQMGLEEKVRLAVRAHVRHVETRYEGLLREGWSRKEARKKVLGRVDEIVKRWEGVEKGTRASLKGKGVVGHGKGRDVVVLSSDGEGDGGNDVVVLDSDSYVDSDSVMDSDSDSDGGKDVVVLDSDGDVVMKSPRKMSLRSSDGVRKGGVGAGTGGSEGFPKPLREGFAKHRRHTGHERKVFREMQENETRSRHGAKKSKPKPNRKSKPGGKGAKGKN